MADALFTIGYEGAVLGDFIDTLAENGVMHVIDVRDVPASRKSGFSKVALSANLDDAGISYTHLKPLGDPKPGREAMRRGDYSNFLRIYTHRVSLPDAQHAISQAVSIATTERAVLFCYERDPKLCHRTLVAQMMKKHSSFQVHHLRVTTSKERESRRW